ncbi:glycosyltransferase family 1 protein [Actinomadura spongiicola]|uniref:Glycosyltransferase family 1 protein n=1 Tax=Actinomadura spongiicola TaxID=2303421 RepID=A0A372GIS9_9ACTN|nr:glycosyltransferase family 1 protein [Actinomadura spongiicola]
MMAHPSPDLYGSDRMFIESVRALAPHGRVVVSLPADGPLSAALRDAGAEIVVQPVPVLRKAYLSPVGIVRLAFAGLRSLPRAVRLLRRERPAALYVNTVTLPLWMLAGRLARVPTVCHVHEAEDGVPRPVRAALHLPLRLARGVIVNSRATAAAVGRPGENARLIYNGVEEPPEPVAAPRAEPGPPARVVLVGRLSQRKGSDIAVKAVRLLRERGRDVTLTLVGDVFPGYEWFEKELRAEVGDDEGAVTFSGFRTSVWDSFAESDIAIVPSRVEPFGNVAVEAMLAGRPLVVADTQGLVEIVTDGDNGVVVRPDDPAALADGIARLLDDWDGALAMAKRARDDAARRFGKDRYHRELRDAVQDLTGRAPARPGRSRP